MRQFWELAVAARFKAPEEDQKHRDRFLSKEIYSFSSSLSFPSLNTFFLFLACFPQFKYILSLPRFLSLVCIFPTAIQEIKSFQTVGITVKANTETVKEVTKICACVCVSVLACLFTDFTALPNHSCTEQTFFFWQSHFGKYMSLCLIT